MTTTTTLLTVPAVIALVNICKGLGVQGRWSTILALGIAALLGSIQMVAPAGMVEQFTQWLTVGLAAAGVYDVLPADVPKSLGKHRAIPPTAE